MNSSGNQRVVRRAGAFIGAGLLLLACGSIAPSARVSTTVQPPAVTRSTENRPVLPVMYFVDAPH